MRVGGAENGDYNYAHAQRFVRERVGHSSAESAHPHTHTPDVSGVLVAVPRLDDK